MEQKFKRSERSIRLLRAIVIVLWTLSGFLLLFVGVSLIEGDWSGAGLILLPAAVLGLAALGERAIMRSVERKYVRMRELSGAPPRTPKRQPFSRRAPAGDAGPTAT
jgi:hypothetical protein